jgi:hypothetical protein
LEGICRPDDAADRKHQPIALSLRSAVDGLEIELTVPREADVEG